jgi:hypothetical protein
MHFLNCSFALLALLGGVHAVSIDLSDYTDGQTSNSFATCDNINAGECCALTNGDTKPFASVIIRGLRNGQVVRITLSGAFVRLTTTTGRCI